MYKIILKIRRSLQRILQIVILKKLKIDSPSKSEISHLERYGTVDELRECVVNLRATYLSFQRESAETITILSSELAEVMHERDSILESIEKQDLSKYGNSDNKLSPLLNNKSRRANFYSPNQAGLGSISTPRSDIYRRSLVYGFRGPQQSMKEKSEPSQSRSKLLTENRELDNI